MFFTQKIIIFFCYVFLNLIAYSEEGQWIRVINHIHTTTDHTCAWEPYNTRDDLCYDKIGLEKIYENAKILNIDAVIITDHNSIASYKEKLFYENSKDMLFILGEEWTTKAGHATIIFNDNIKPIIPANPLDKPNKIQYKKMIKEVNRIKALIFANHPFLYYNDLYDFRWPEDILDINGIEILSNPFNGQSEAIDFWQKKLEEGHKLVGIAGSDYHFSQPFPLFPGNYNYVYVKEKTKKEIINAFKLGHLQTHQYYNSPMITISVDDFMMGDTIDSPTDIIKLKLDVINGARKNIVLYSKNGKFDTIYIQSDKFSKILNLNKKDSSDFIRIEIPGYTYTNPIYY
jgi:predicted metal-dependent phosphoesterase TrpH